jgi:hypothetical protein
MNYEAIRPALKELTRTLVSANSGLAVEWKGAVAAGAFRKGPRVTMSLRSIRGVGKDEWRRSGATLRYAGARMATLTFKLEGESPLDEDIIFAAADRLRMGLRFESSTAVLNALGLGVATIEPTETIEFNTQGNSRSVAVIDVQLNAVDNQVDDNDGTSDTIELTTVSSQDDLIGEDEEPTSHQVDEEIDGTQPL